MKDKTVRRLSGVETSVARWPVKTDESEKMRALIKRLFPVGSHRLLYLLRKKRELGESALTTAEQAELKALYSDNPPRRRLRRDLDDIAERGGIRVVDLWQALHDLLCEPVLVDHVYRWDVPEVADVLTRYVRECAYQVGLPMEEHRQREEKRRRFIKEYKEGRRLSDSQIDYMHLSRDYECSKCTVECDPSCEWATAALGGPGTVRDDTPGNASPKPA